MQGTSPPLQADGTSSSVLTTTSSSSTYFAQSYAKIPGDIAATSPISRKKSHIFCSGMADSHHDLEKMLEMGVATCLHMRN